MIIILKSDINCDDKTRLERMVAESYSYFVSNRGFWINIIDKHLSREDKPSVEKFRKLPGVQDVYALEVSAPETKAS